MKEDTEMRQLDPHILLSTLWLFILLNIVFRDIHQFVLASHLEMLLTGYYNGMEITEELMLLGGVLVQVPIAMVLFSLLLPRRIGRPVTILAAMITMGTLLSSAPSDLDDTFHLVIELAALAAILWTAWTWTDQERAAAQAGNQHL